MQDSADKSSQGRQLEQANRRVNKLETDIANFLEEVKDLKGKVKQLEGQRETLETDLKSSNAEIKKIEDSLSGKFPLTIYLCGFV